MAGQIERRPLDAIPPRLATVPEPGARPGTVATRNDAEHAHGGQANKQFAHADRVRLQQGLLDTGRRRTPSELPSPDAGPQTPSTQLHPAQIRRRFGNGPWRRAVRRGVTKPTRARCNQPVTLPCRQNDYANMLSEGKERRTKRRIPPSEEKINLNEMESRSAGSTLPGHMGRTRESMYSTTSKKVGAPLLYGSVATSSCTQSLRDSVLAPPSRTMSSAPCTSSFTKMGSATEFSDFVRVSSSLAFARLGKRCSVQATMRIRSPSRKRKFPRRILSLMVRKRLELRVVRHRHVQAKPTSLVALRS